MPESKSNGSFSLASPWWFTDKVIRKYLAQGVPYLKGRLLDVGCGWKPYRRMFACDEYVGMEWTDACHPDVVGDVRDMKMFAAGEFDSVLCNQMLEHVDDSERALAEIQRVLKPGGHLCITVPFVGRLHCVPHDYWRFSPYGLRYLLEKTGFEVLALESMGGFWTTQCFLWSFYTYERCRRFKLLRILHAGALLLLNPLFLLIHRLDRDQTTSFNYIAIARKRGAVSPRAGSAAAAGPSERAVK